MLRAWARGGLLSVALSLCLGCSTARQTGREAPSSPSDAESRPQASLDAPEADAEVAEQPPEPTAEAPPPEPSYEVLARAAIGEDGAELRIEAIEEGFGIRLGAGSKQGVAVEPLGKITGPSTAGIYFGAGCHRVEKGRATLLGRWNGELRSCVTAARPMAVLEGDDGRGECTLARAEPGAYKVTLWPCGGYEEPLVSVDFTLNRGR